MASKSQKAGLSSEGFGGSTITWALASKDPPKSLNPGFRV